MSAWQTNKVYDAEHEVGRYGEALSVEEAERFITKVKNSVWWCNRTKVENIELKIVGDLTGKQPDPGAIKESWKRGRLWIYVRSLYKDHILHELSHLITWPKPKHPTHGPDFVAVYLHLLQVWTSCEFAGKMQKAFTERGVEWDE
jgi:hypothetical protein